MLLLRKMDVFVVVIVVSSELPGGVSERLPGGVSSRKKKVFKIVAIYNEFVLDKIARQKSCVLQRISDGASLFPRRHASHFRLVEAKRSHKTVFLQTPSGKA